MKAIINHKILLLKTSVIVKLNVIITDKKKKKSNINDSYNYSNKDKIFMIYNNLEKYIKHLKRDLGSMKQNLKTISAHQTDSHKSLMRL